MGPTRDAVVNSELKVYGAKQLRVIDTSIIPISASSHTNAASFMIGEVGADLIKKDWQQRQSRFSYYYH
jgi:choline dehydrogenase-like flavoprotein